MNILAPVSTIMTTDVIALNPRDPLTKVKEIFDENRIHHIPIVQFKNLVGIVSKTDLIAFLKGVTKFTKNAPNIDGMRLRNFSVNDIMTEGIAKVEPNTRIDVVLEILKENLFHAVPVVNEKNELQGIVTTYDIIKTLSQTSYDEARKQTSS